MASQLLPTTNGDGVPIVPMSEAQRYIFDLKGWICLPGLLSDDELGTVLEHQHKLMEEPESLPPEERNSVGGPSQVMLDHPVSRGFSTRSCHIRVWPARTATVSASSAPAPNGGPSATTNSSPTVEADTSTSVEIPISTRCCQGRSTRASRAWCGS